MSRVEVRSSLPKGSRTVALSALVVVIIGALLVVFALSLNETIRYIAFNYLEICDTFWGHILYSLIVFIIVAFIVVIVSLRYPNIIDRVF